jgi:hypothetical protein
MLVHNTCPPSFESSDPFINTGNGVNILLKGSEKFVVNFDRIHRMITVLSGPGDGNVFLGETQGRFGESGNSP